MFNIMLFCTASHYSQEELMYKLRDYFPASTLLPETIDDKFCICAVSDKLLFEDVTKLLMRDDHGYLLNNTYTLECYSLPEDIQLFRDTGSMGANVIANCAKHEVVWRDVPGVGDVSKLCEYVFGKYDKCIEDNFGGEV